MRNDLTPFEEVAAKVDGLSRQVFAELDREAFMHQFDHLCRLGIVRGSTYAAWERLNELDPACVAGVFRSLEQFHTAGGSEQLHAALTNYLEEGSQ